MKELIDIRRDFPLLNDQGPNGPICYLDSAATAQKPQIVIDAMSDFYKHRYASVHRGVYRLASEATEMFESCRGRVARFLGAKDPDEIIFTRGTTDSLNLLAQSLKRSGLIKPGHEIVVSPLEHHANLLPWQMLAEDTGATLVALRANGAGRIDLDAFQSILNDQTRLICISQMSNVTGALYPIKEMTRLARDHSKAHMVIDGAQSVSHLRIDVRSLDCDFFCFSGHKLFGPTGVGVLFGKMEHLQRLPPASGGGHIVEDVLWNKSSFGPPPARFEPGTPMIAEVIGLGAALTYLEGLDRAKIDAHEKELTERCVGQLAEIRGLRVLGEPAGPIISFDIEGVHALDVATWLDSEGICIRSGSHCAQPAMLHFGVKATARISMALYNSIEEIDRTIISLKRGLQLLR